MSDDNKLSPHWIVYYFSSTVKLAGKILQDDEKQLVLDMWDLSGRPVSIAECFLHVTTTRWE